MIVFAYLFMRETVWQSVYRCVVSLALALMPQAPHFGSRCVDPFPISNFVFQVAVPKV